MQEVELKEREEEVVSIKNVSYNYDHSFIAMFLF